MPKQAHFCLGLYFFAAFVKKIPAAPSRPMLRAAFGCLLFLQWAVVWIDALTPFVCIRKRRLVCYRGENYEGKSYGQFGLSRAVAVV